MLNRWVEDDGLLDTLEGLGVGSIVFSPLAQGMLTDKYLRRHSGGQPRGAGQIAAPGLPQRTDDRQYPGARTRIAEKRGQTLAQMALAWVLRDGRVTSALIGASRPEQIEDCVGALANQEFSADELAEIDRYAKDANINLWARSAEHKGPPRNK